MTDYLSEGQIVKVKVLETDEKGRVKLSMKALTERPAGMEFERASAARRRVASAATAVIVATAAVIVATARPRTAACDRASHGERDRGRAQQPPRRATSSRVGAAAAKSRGGDHGSERQCHAGCGRS